MKRILNYLIGIVMVTTTLTSCGGVNDKDSSNPFFSEYNTPYNVPPFDKIRPEHFIPAFEKGMEEGRKELQAILDNPDEPTFENTIVALDKMGALLDKVGSAFSEIAGSNTNEEIQNIEMEISPKLSSYSDEISLNPDLFKRIKSVYDNASQFNLTEEEEYILKEMYMGFVRNGANLSVDDQNKLKEINQRLSVLCVQFDQNVLNETNDFIMYVDEKDLVGLPESVIATAAETAKEAGQEGKWAFTTQRPSMYPFLTYSPNRELRRKLYDAYLNRGNNGNENDNNAVFAEIVKLRAEKAKLLGYKSHADLALDAKMAKTQKNVYDLLNNIWEKALVVAKDELAEMQRIADKEGANFKLDDSDWWYYAEKLRKEKYDIDDSTIRQYFALENVQKGLFEVVHRLFGVNFEEVKDIPKVHPDAVAYNVTEADGSHLGLVYFDFYPRASKSQGAWCSTIESHHYEDGVEIPAIVSTVFNFTKPSGNDPALLNIDEVETMFHEFGHALDAMMNENRYNSKYIPWDFVELPSQILEHWAMQPEVLKMYAKHYKTDEIIPDNLITKISNSEFFNQGFDNVELIAASLLDMAYYTLEAPVELDVQKFEKEYMKEIGLIPEIQPRYRTTYFLHIIDGYDAGYYNYTWAAVLDNDGFEAFKENGLFDQATAQSYRQNILAKNGIMDASEQYRRFRGHDPEITPLLKNRGLIK